MAGGTTASGSPGDAGRTSLATGRRVAKDSPRVEACGGVDELNSALGVALAARLAAPLPAIVEEVQRDLFVLGAELARPRPGSSHRGRMRITRQDVRRLEDHLARLQPELKPLRHFILPGGAPGAAQLHLARAVCRRVERGMVALKRAGRLGDQVVPYLNRLSKLLFSMARYENHRRGVAETLWIGAGADGRDEG